MVSFAGWASAAVLKSRASCLSFSLDVATRFLSSVVSDCVPSLDTSSLSLFNEVTNWN